MMGNDHFSCGLVVWNMTFIFLYIGNVIIPIDFHIFRSHPWKMAHL